jgi:hypothetical protein
MKKYLKKISLLALIVTVFSCNDSDLVIDSLKTQQGQDQWHDLCPRLNFAVTRLTFGSDAPFTLLLELKMKVRVKM